MKKNNFMRIASVLMVLTLLSTCAISGTFAKYVTSADATDSAHVAKWGVKITANGSTFATSYDNTNAPSVKAEGSYNVVAPGTSGEMVKMTLTGKPEVDVKVTYEAELTLTNWNDGYCPLVITVNTKDFYINSTDIETPGDLQAAVVEEINKYSKEYDVNTNLSTVGNNSLAISWKWYYEAGTAGNPLSAYQNDTQDTVLGDAAATGTAIPTITLKVTTTVTQVD